MRSFSDRCPFCGGLVRFDAVYDLNMCHHCGAQETTKGWMHPDKKTHGTTSETRFDDSDDS